MTQQELEAKLIVWKQNSLEIPVQLKSTMFEKESHGHVYYKEWLFQERTRRALKTSGIFFALTLLSIPIPIAHFVLVPLFLLATPISGIMAFNIENTILGGVAKCPDCEQNFDISKSKVQWPIKDVCSHCKHILLIHQASGEKSG